MRQWWDVLPGISALSILLVVRSLQKKLAMFDEYD